MSITPEDKTNGRWTNTEHQQFLMGLQIYGKNWKKIEQIIGTRSGSQIRSHAQKFFLKMKSPSTNSPKRASISESMTEEDLNGTSLVNNADSPFNRSQPFSTGESVLCELESNVDANSSFFVGQIQQFSKQEMDFWGNFIDVSKQRPSISRRKGENDENNYEKMAEDNLPQKKQRGQSFGWKSHNSAFKPYKNQNSMISE